MSAAIMDEYGRLDHFFLYIAPHGQLELYSIFVAGAAGLLIFWAWIAPGARTRRQALAEDGRALLHRRDRAHRSRCWFRDHRGLRHPAGLAVAGQDRHRHGRARRRSWSTSGWSAAGRTGGQTGDLTSSRRGAADRRGVTPARAPSSTCAGQMRRCWAEERPRAVGVARATSRGRTAACQLKPAISAADDRRDDEHPELAERIRAAEDRGRDRARRVQRGVADRDR